MADVPQTWVIDDLGVTIPDAAQLVESTVATLQQADELGGDYLFDDDDDMTAAIRIVCQQIAKAYAFGQAIAASFDPNQATGVMLRDRGSLVSAEYASRSRSVIPGTLFGASGIIIPQGSILLYVPGNSLWETVAQYVLSLGGTADAELQAREYGPVEAALGPSTDWVIQTPVAGWTPPAGGFVPSAAGTPGQLAADDLEVREAILLAGRGGAGAATYDADVQNVAALTGAPAGASRPNYVALFVNRTLIYDAAQDLNEKRGRFVVEGAKKQDILDAIVNTQSTGLNTTDTGTVVGTSTRFDGKVITASFTRPVDVPIQFQVTLEGDLLPPQAECELVVDAAVAARCAEQDVAEKVVPEQYRAAVVAAFGENVVELCVVGVRRDSGDPYQTTPLVLSASAAERATVSTAPSAAEILGTAEEALEVLTGMTLNLDVDGAPIAAIVFTGDWTLAAQVVADIEAQVGADVDAIDADGRVLVRSPTVGASSSIEITGGTATAALGLDGFDEGTDGDVEVILL